MSSVLHNVLKTRTRTVTLLKNVQRSMSAASKLVYSEFGDPLKVIRKEEYAVPEPRENEVTVKMLAAPVNPADINTIQGKYPVKPPFPAVAGNEGVAEIVAVGEHVRTLKLGDRVVPLQSGLGTWRTHLAVDACDLLKVPQSLKLEEAASLTVNPCTAYRMLKDFAQLEPGDTVIQNGANSACGQNVIQICRSWGVSSVNIVRDRPELPELVSFLKSLGATHVLTEEALRSTDIFKKGDLRKPMLALNCVGGKSALELTRHLQFGGTMVTYGGMSREPVTIPTSALIFKDIQLRGFWNTRWAKENYGSDNYDRQNMFEELISLITNNELQAPAHKMVKFDDYKEALMNTMTIKGMIGKKYILKF